MKTRAKKDRLPAHRKAEPNYDAIHRIQSRRRRRNIIGGLAVVLVIAVLIGVIVSLWNPPGSVAVGASAPDFTLKEVSTSGFTGSSITLASHQGSVVLLEFMVSWCPHCQNVAPTVESVYQQYGSSGVYVLAVAETWTSAEGVQANLASTQTFMQQAGSQYKYVLDETGTVASTYGVTGTPTFFILDKSGKITATMSGEQTYDALSNAIQVALNR